MSDARLITDSGFNDGVCGLVAAAAAAAATSLQGLRADTINQEKNIIIRLL